MTTISELQHWLRIATQQQYEMEREDHVAGRSYYIGYRQALERAIDIISKEE